jgi:hypothetical protein
MTSNKKQSEVIGCFILNNSYNPITNTACFEPGFVNYRKGCTRLTAISDKVYQLLAHGWWFSPGTPASCADFLIFHIGTKIQIQILYWFRNPMIGLSP